MSKALVLDAPGAYLWIAGIFEGDASATPRLRQLRVEHDADDWMRHLPALYTRSEPARTFPSLFPLLSLDRIYVRNCSVHLPVVLPRKPWSHLSDHAPLAAEITL